MVTYTRLNAHEIDARMQEASRLEEKRKALGLRPRHDTEVSIMLRDQARMANDASAASEALRKLRANMGKETNASSFAKNTEELAQQAMDLASEHWNAENSVRDVRYSINELHDRPQLAIYTKRYCLRSGLMIGEISDECAHLLNAFLQNDNTCTSFLGSTHSQALHMIHGIAPHWLNTSPGELALLRGIDPAGYFVYLANYWTSSKMQAPDSAALVQIIEARALCADMTTPDILQRGFMLELALGFGTLPEKVKTHNPLTLAKMSQREMHHAIAAWLEVCYKEATSSVATYEQTLIAISKGKRKRRKKVVVNLETHAKAKQRGKVATNIAKTKKRSRTKLDKHTLATPTLDEMLAMSGMMDAIDGLDISVDLAGAHSHELALADIEETAIDVDDLLSVDIDGAMSSLDTYDNDSDDDAIAELEEDRKELAFFKELEREHQLEVSRMLQEQAEELSRRAKMRYEQKEDFTDIETLPDESDLDAIGAMYGLDD